MCQSPVFDFASGRDVSYIWDSVSCDVAGLSLGSELSNLSGIALAEQWLDQFADQDRELARSLLDEVHLVPAKVFSDGIFKLIDQVAAERPAGERKIALYAERPVPSAWGTIPSFFPNSRRGRAAGPGVPPIKVDARDQEVGSEGPIAQMITTYCRLHPTVALSHPGPTKLRKDRVSHIVIVTDFIGSGDRIYQMLESFRYVATLRSWHSYKLIKFVVIAYAATDAGLHHVQLSRLPHTINVQVGCPTISGVFRGARRKLIEKLCWHYPRKSDPFGWRAGGALIAFAHGCPNNAPAMFWSEANSWQPIFGGRTTIEASDAFAVNEAGLLNQRTERLLGIRDAREKLTSHEGNCWITAMTTLAAVDDGARRPMQISARTILPLKQVNEVLDLCVRAGWLDAEYKLTVLGQMELKRLRRRLRRKPVFPNDENPFYYPSQLRAP